MKFGNSYIYCFHISPIYGVVEWKVEKKGNSYEMTDTDNLYRKMKKKHINIFTNLKIYIFI